MANLLEVQNELAKKYARTIDHAAYKYITETIGWLKERGEDPADYELVMQSVNTPEAPFTIQWKLKIEKRAGKRGLVD